MGELQNFLKQWLLASNSVVKVPSAFWLGELDSAFIPKCFLSRVACCGEAMCGTIKHIALARHNR